MFALHSVGALLLIVVYNVSSMLGSYTHTCMLTRVLHHNSLDRASPREGHLIARYDGK
jgi:hypothetical protein